MEEPLDTTVTFVPDLQMACALTFQAITLEQAVTEKHNLLDCGLNLLVPSVGRIIVHRGQT